MMLTHLLKYVLCNYFTLNYLWWTFSVVMRDHSIIIFHAVNVIPFHIYKNEWTQVHDTINTHQY